MLQAVPVDRVDQLAGAIERTSRFLNLFEIAASYDSAPLVMANVETCVVPSDRESCTEIEQVIPAADRGGADISVGTTVTAAVENQSEGAVDLTVIYLNEHFQPVVVYPSPGDSGRLEADDRWQVAETYKEPQKGTHHLLIIAHEAGESPIPMTHGYLASDADPQSRGARGAFGELLVDAGWKGGSRSARVDVDSTQIAHWSWTIQSEDE
jgi:hypothetical protein